MHVCTFGVILIATNQHSRIHEHSSHAQLWMTSRWDKGWRTTAGNTGTAVRSSSCQHTHILSIISTVSCILKKKTKIRAVKLTINHTTAHYYFQPIYLWYDRAQKLQMFKIRARIGIRLNGWYKQILQNDTTKNQLSQKIASLSTSGTAQIFKS